jgi:hypothetical protein
MSDGVAFPGIYVDVNFAVMVEAEGFPHIRV